MGCQRRFCTKRWKWKPFLQPGRLRRLLFGIVQRKICSIILKRVSHLWRHIMHPYWMHACKLSWKKNIHDLRSHIDRNEAPVSYLLSPQDLAPLNNYLFLQMKKKRASSTGDTTGSFYMKTFQVCLGMLKGMKAWCVKVYIWPRWKNFRSYWIPDNDVKCMTNINYKLSAYIYRRLNRYNYH